MKQTKFAVVALEGNETSESICELVEFGRLARKELINLLELLAEKGVEPCKSVPANELVEAIRAPFTGYKELLKR